MFNNLVDEQGPRGASSLKETIHGFNPERIGDSLTMPHGLM